MFGRVFTITRPGDPADGVKERQASMALSFRSV